MTADPNKLGPLTESDEDKARAMLLLEMEGRVYEIVKKAMLKAFEDPDVLTKLVYYTPLRSMLTSDLNFKRDIIELIKGSLHA
jgi:hypothetical protein